MPTRTNICPRDADCKVVSCQASSRRRPANKHPQGKACIVLSAELRPILTKFVHPNAERRCKQKGPEVVIRLSWTVPKSTVSTLLQLIVACPS